MIHISRELDPLFNLALEEWFFRNREGDDFDLLIYRNGASVIVGRNQNPWLECDLAHIARTGIGFARRFSGGGTVYHDEGNLNVSMLMPRGAYDPSGVVDLVRLALANLGLDSTECERHALWLGERKILGSAYALTKRSALSHVCILVEAELGDLGRCLRPTVEGLSGKSTRSVPAPVTNVHAVCPDIDIAGLRASVMSAYENSHGVSGVHEWTAADLAGDAEFAEFLAKYRGWEWVFGRTPSFVHEVTCAIGAGGQRLALEVKKACVSDVMPIGGEVPGLCIERLASIWRGVRYDGELLAEAGREMAAEESCMDAELLVVLEGVAEQVPAVSGLVIG